MTIFDGVVWFVDGLIVIASIILVIISIASAVRGNKGDSSNNNNARGEAKDIWIVIVWCVASVIACCTIQNVRFIGNIFYWKKEFPAE